MADGKKFEEGEDCSEFTVDPPIAPGESSESSDHAMPNHLVGFCVFDEYQ